MTLIKKRKDFTAPDSSENKEQKSDKSKKAIASDDTPAAEETTVAADIQNGEDSTESGAASADKAKKDESGEAKQPSEADILRVYLKKALEEVKKQKDENESLKAQLEQLNSLLAESKNRYESLVAEYDNYRRRTTAEKEGLGAESTGKAVLALLPALDNLERAMPFAESNPESFTKGVDMTLRQLQDAFKSLGVEEIEAQGAEFDPELHEAVMHVDDDSLGESVVTDVFQKGYRIGDKVVRHSVVKVAN